MSKLSKPWFSEISEEEKNNERYEVLRAKYLSLGFSNIEQALDSYHYRLWLDKLKKFNKTGFYVGTTYNKAK